MIKIVSPNHPSLQLYTGDYSIGACDDKTKCVYICEGLPSHKFKKVLCHELTHAAMFSYHVDLSWEQEELMADLIATYGQEIIYETNNFFNRLKK